MADYPRRVTVHAQHRSVALDNINTSPDGATNRADRHGLSYAGVLISRMRGDASAEEIWLPMGNAPTFADDEKLIAALHQALHWARDRA